MSRVDLYRYAYRNCQDNTQISQIWWTQVALEVRLAQHVVQAHPSTLLPEQQGTLLFETGVFLADDTNENVQNHHCEDRHSQIQQGCL